MIVTVTPNPSIDRTVRIPRLVQGDLVRATGATAEAAGKGVNVARVLAAQGADVIAVAPLSESSGVAFRALLGAGLRLEAVTIRGDVRVNVSLIEDDGTVTKVNEPGPTLDEHEADELLQRTAALVRENSAAWVIASGSLPPGAPTDFYARLGAALPPAVRFAVDADGGALRAALAARPALIKPNQSELERLVGRPLRTLGAVIGAAADVLRTGPSAVLVSLGADGAVFVDGRSVAHAEARIDDVDNPVGAGDALLAGFIAAGADQGALPEAVAWSVAACRSPGTQVRVVEARDRAAVVVHDDVASERRLAA